MKYLWTEGIEKPEFPKLKSNRKTDVLIIGGGMAGILCALMLKEEGVDYLLVEGETIGGGITKGTTAVLTAQHDTLYGDLWKKFGREKAKQYLVSNLDSVQRFRTLAQLFPCDFEEVPSLMYSVTDGERLRRESEAIQSLGFDASFTKDVPLPIPVAGAVRFPGMAQFHPLKFLYGAAKELNIFEHTFVRRLEGTTAYTDHCRIHARKVIVATHFPFVNRHGMYFMKLYQQRSFVIALENAPQLGCTTVDMVENGIYLRNYKNMLLVGGGDSRTGTKGGGFSAVREFAGRAFPEAKEVYAWTNQDCMSLDGVPYIGRYSPHMPNVYVATGFNEWGMTSSMVAAEILTDQICRRTNKEADVFVPSRNMFTGQLFTNLGTTLAHFIMPTPKRCSHLGCALKWNPEEKSWDCPCHGSRFSEDGKVIQNPAMKNLHGNTKK